jgi:hypothetical protein
LAGGSVLASLLSYWSAHRFEPILNVLPAVLGTSLMVIGAQNILSGFLIAIINGNNADFMQTSPPSPAASPIQPATGLTPITNKTA